MPSLFIFYNKYKTTSILLRLEYQHNKTHSITINQYKNSSGDEIANVLVNDDIAHT